MTHPAPLQRNGLAIAALALLLLTIEALAPLLRLAIAHAAALALLLAGWRPAAAAPAPVVKRAQPITPARPAVQRRKRTARRLVEVAA